MVRRFTLALTLFAFLFAGSLPVLKYRALDNSGLPINNASLYFYAAGTTTPQATYSDSGLTSANANPVVSDSSGYFGEIYLTTTVTYKVVLKDASGSTIWTVDNISGSQLAGSSLGDRLEQVASNPLDYGAIGDGAADESSEVQSAIDNATMVVDLLGKTFRCDSTLTVGSDLIIRNGTLDFTNSTDNNFITLTGSQGGAVALSSNGDPGDVQIAVASASGLAAGDWIVIYSTANWASTDRSGEITQVESVSGTTLQLTNPLEGEYLTANTASIKEYTPISNVRFENLTIQSSTTQSGTGRVVYGTIVRDLVFDNVKFEGIKAAGIRIEAGVNIKVQNSAFDNDDGSGKGVIFASGTRDGFVSNSTFRRLDTGIDIGQATDAYNDSVSRWIHVDGNTFYGGENGVILGQPTQHISITNNDFVSDLAASAWGVQSDSGVDVSITGNRFTSGQYGVELTHAVTAVTGRLHSTLIANNRFDAPDDNAIKITTTAAISNLQVLDNAIVNTTTAGNYSINLTLGTTATNIAVSGNSIYGVSGGHGIRLVSNHATAPAGVSVSDNAITLLGAGIGVYLDSDTGNFSGVSISGNNIVGTATTPKGIWVEDAENLSIVDNFISTSLIGILFHNDSNTSTGITIDSNTLTGAKTGIDLDVPTPISMATISGNMVTGCNAASNYCLHVDGRATEVAIVGNAFLRSDDLDSNIEITGDAAGYVDYVNVSGNMLRNGDNCIGESTDANATNVVTVANLYRSCTANVEGTVANEYMNMDKLEFAAPADLGATCTTGQLKIDNATTTEMCYCQTTNTWYCWTIDDTTGPAD